ncbi:hypothetical protein Y032_0237g3241 [Ancylostoma ceylanicum]|uniref:Uncharacterized protein n=1 Tax=Ancylostoma ceylanicum TaxID=53326 RepID=A0A016SEQ2_9BILA|nr:hypothetical protein Y032_0237g3241 [Ancylostoma ceylanicum]
MRAPRSRTQVASSKSCSIARFIADIFAVLAPIGPLRKVQEKAGDYSHDVLRFLMFTADAKQTPEIEKESSEEESDEEEEGTKAASDVADKQQPVTDTSSFTLTSEESEEETVPKDEKPLLRRRVRQAAGSDKVNIVENMAEEERKKKEERKQNERKIKKDKNSDLSSDDDEFVEVQPEVNDAFESAHNDNTNMWDAKYHIDDQEALSMSKHKKVLESSSSSSSTSCDFSALDEETETEKVSVTAADALNDANSLRLGMGDFVFYSVLVGQAATTGSVGATIAAALGVVYGLLVTLTYFSNGCRGTHARLGPRFYRRVLYRAFRKESVLVHSRTVDRLCGCALPSMLDIDRKWSRISP